MHNYFFTFALHTDKDVFNGSIFDMSGEVIGRIVHKFVSKTSSGVTYDVESTKETFEKIESGEIKIWGAEKYYVSNSSTAYYRD